MKLMTSRGNQFHAAKYQNISCTSKGVLRNTETHTPTIVLARRLPVSRRLSSEMAMSVASTIPASVTQSVVRKPEIIHCRGCPLSTPCQFIACIMMITPGVTGRALFSGNAGFSGAVVGRKNPPAGPLQEYRHHR
ncbi:hypothetical protein SDC9_134962 [bioreactor metagenome]|uniref:Uncharacterized protein n=1 Tax=bioreactor metagenome TaxID=1076179 RepID=A0A645DH01_9ZZZZ